MEPGFQPPPPPGGNAPENPLPWEDRERLGFVPALIETIKLLVTAPQDAFARAKKSGDFASPLLFAVLVAWVGIVVNQIWGLAFGTSFMAFLPADIRDQMGLFMASSIFGTIISVILAPIFILIGLFISCGILHLCLMMVGGLANSQGGFEGTLRAVGYSHVAHLANVIPVLGGVIAFVWGLVLYVLGLVALHETTTGKAVLAILIPVVLCCVCIVLFFVLFAGAIAGIAASAN